MELYQELFMKALLEEKMEIVFPEIQQRSLRALLESICYTSLRRIRDIVRDETLEDSECFMRIEAVIEELERIGSHGGSRHDFG